MLSVESNRLPNHQTGHHTCGRLVVHSLPTPFPQYFMIDAYATLRLVHITCFAAWMGNVIASRFFIRSIEEKMTDQQGDAEPYRSIMMRFIKAETKITDIAVPGVLISGLMLAGLYHGWTFQVILKGILFATQVILTLGYIAKAIRPLSYPCTTRDYQKWYRLFSISFTMFGIILYTSFFLL